MAGPMDSVGRAARHGMLLVVECRHCRKVGYHKAGEVAKIAGFGTPLKSVKFICSRCGRRDVVVKTMFVDWIPFRPAQGLDDDARSGHEPPRRMPCAYGQRDEIPDAPVAQVKSAPCQAPARRRTGCG